jgi:transcriptional regulator with XRE-family HTH domain
MAKEIPTDGLPPFARRLKELREAAGLTQAQLAERCGLHLSTVFKLEQGRRAPAWDTVQILCRGLNLPCTAFETIGEAGGSAGQPRGPGGPKKAAEGAAPKKTARRRKAT